MFFLNLKLVHFQELCISNSEATLDIGLAKEANILEKKKANFLTEKKLKIG